MNHNAIYALYPNVVRIDDTEGVFDKDGNPAEIDLSLIDNWVDPNEYRYQRKNEYPPIGDQLDALWKGGKDAEEMLIKIQAIKDKYPKVN